MEKHSDIPMRNDTAKQYRNIRSILKNNKAPKDGQLLRGIMIYFMLFSFCLLVWFFIIMFTTNAHAYTEEQMIKAVIGESEGEPQHGKEAVACAIRNRGTLHGVYGLNAPRVKHHLYSEKTYQNAVYAVEMSRNSDYCQSLIHGAQFWEGTKFPIPYWADGMYQTAIIGNQRFFRKIK